MLVTVIIDCVIMMISSMRRMDMLIIMHMRNGFAHAAVGQHHAEEQNRANQAQHCTLLAERRADAK